MFKSIITAAMLIATTATTAFATGIPTTQHNPEFNTAARDTSTDPNARHVNVRTEIHHGWIFESKPGDAHFWADHRAFAINGWSPADLRFADQFGSSNDSTQMKLNTFGYVDIFDYAFRQQDPYGDFEVIDKVTYHKVTHWYGLECEWTHFAYYNDEHGIQSDIVTEYVKWGLCGQYTAGLQNVATSYDQWGNMTSIQYYD